MQNNTEVILNLGKIRVHLIECYLPLKSVLFPPALPFMGLTSPGDEREALVALFQKANTSQLVTKLITQELLKMHQAGSGISTE